MKKNSPQKPPPVGEVIRRTIGTDLTIRDRVSVQVIQKGKLVPLSPKAEALLDPSRKYNRQRDGNRFDVGIAEWENIAKQVLEKAGLPSDPRMQYYDIKGGCYSTKGRLPDFSGFNPSHQTEYPDGDLVAYVKSEGYAEYTASEWYAAQILYLINKVRYCIEKNIMGDAAFYAAKLGYLAHEARFKEIHEPLTLRGMAHDKGSRSPKPPRRNLALENYIAYRRRDRDLTFEDFCEELRTRDDGDPLVHGNTEICSDPKNDRLMVYDGRNERSYSFRTLERYWKGPRGRAK